MDDARINNEDTILFHLMYYNFDGIQQNNINQFLFSDLCKLDYSLLVEYFLKYKSFDINQTYRDISIYFFKKQLCIQLLKMTILKLYVY